MRSLGEKQALGRVRSAVHNIEHLARRAGESQPIGVCRDDVGGRGIAASLGALLGPDTLIVDPDAVERTPQVGNQLRLLEEPLAGNVGVVEISAESGLQIELRLEIFEI